MAHTLAYQPHDHSQCVSKAVGTAQALCQRNGARLTALRKRVLTLVWQSHQPLGAYQLLELLQQDQDSKDDAEKKRHLAPPTVYRALEFLQQQGLIHRIASLNAYIGCVDPSSTHDGHFYICKNCRKTAEFVDQLASQAITHCGNEAGFSVESQAVEVFGLCPDCNHHKDSVKEEQTL